jgi:hypothetical protein
MDEDTSPREPALSPYEFPTEALLDEHVASADALRADLDALRRQLDTAPPPLTPPRPHGYRRLLPLLVVIAVLAAIALVAAISVAAGTYTRTPDARSTAATTEAATTPPTPTGADAPSVAPLARLPRTGPGITTPGTFMLVKAGSDGHLDVTEQAMLPEGQHRISLRLPSMASLGGQVAELNPTVHDLRVSVNGTPVPATPTADGPGWVVLAPAGAPAHTVQLSYQVQDAIVRTRPSDDGRALGVSLPLLGQALRDQGLPLLVRAEGAGVSGVSCPSAPAPKMLCGQQIDDGWLATIPPEAATATLLLQLKNYASGAGA